MFTPIQKLTFKQKMQKGIIIWALVMATIFIGSYTVQNLRQKYLAIETPIYKTDNTLCELSNLIVGDSIKYLGKERVISDINYWSWGELEITFIK